MHVLAFMIGVALSCGAVALLIADGWTGHFTITHALQPLLVGGTVAAAAFVHRARWLAKPMFLALALVGSLVTIYGTMARQAESRDSKIGTAARLQDQRKAKAAELVSAKAGQAAECVRIGPRCSQWNSRADQLTVELGQLPVVSLDPRADTVARLAVLFGLDGARVSAIIAAVDPIMLPLFLELGSMVFFAAAFPRGRKPSTVVANTEETVHNTEATLNSCARAWTQAEALRDFLQMREVGAQRFLAARYGVDKSTVSRWLKDWEKEGHIRRERDGKSKQVSIAALPAPPKANPSRQLCGTN